MNIVIEPTGQEGYLYDAGTRPMVPTFRRKKSTEHRAQMKRRFLVVRVDG